MSNPFNIDVVVELVKNIVNSNRCVICDKCNGPRSRYVCGHTACDDCVLKADCLLCLTPPETTTLNEPVFDYPLSKRITNAAKLLKDCQDAFNVDVFKRHRVSEQLKIEKVLFPKCIQAPIKYSNKRKSSNVSVKNKENRLSFYAGEQISPVKNSKMENSNYVQQWLVQNEKDTRRPFSDLKVNDRNLQRKPISPIKRRVDLIIDNVHKNTENVPKKQTNRKRTHLSTLSTVESQSLLDKNLKIVKRKRDCAPKKIKLKSEPKTKISIQNIFKKIEKDESGIVIDDEVEPIIIDDSQNEVVDKDKLAWQAVLKAHENESLDSIPPMRLECSEVVKYTDDVEKTLTKSKGLVNENDTSGFTNVPFYKKGLLCYLSNKGDDKNQMKVNNSAGKSKHVSITIENKSFTTIIKVSNVTQNNSKSLKQSVTVQTDIQGVDTEQVPMEKTNFTEQKHSNKLSSAKIYKNHEIKNGGRSQDLFTAEAIAENIFDKSEQQKENDESKEAAYVVIADSDSDDSVNHSSTMQVIADVHRSSDQFDYNVLTEIDQKEIGLRTKRASRGLTPTSTDSSDKENYDPNRAKRIKHGKKGIEKKNRKKHDVIPFIV